eukprot:tig00021073_g18045.t1
MGDVAELDAILTRLAVTPEDRLQLVLSKLLPAVIRTLRGGDPAVLKKAMEVLSHCNKRVKVQPSIQLPIADLLALFKEPTTTNVMQNFCLVYLEMGFARAPVADRAPLVPALLDGIASRPATQQEMILHMAVAALDKSKMPLDAAERKAAYVFAQSAADRALFLDFAMDFLLYVPLPPEKDPADPTRTFQPTPAGMSAAAVKRVLRDKPPPTMDALSKTKVELVTFLASGVFPEAAILPHVLVASCDPSGAVGRAAEEATRKQGRMDLDAPEAVAPLFSLYLGRGDRSPASLPLKAKIVPYLCRSVAAANRFPDTLSVVSDCVYGAAAGVKLKHAGMQFAVWVFKQAREEELLPAAGQIKEGLLRLLAQLRAEAANANHEAQSLREFTYVAVGQLARRAGALFAGDLAVPALFFDALASETPNARYSVQEGLSALCAAFRGAPLGPLEPELEALLLRAISGTEHQPRLAAVQWGSALLPFRHPAARFLCLLGQADPRPEVRDEAAKGLAPPAPARPKPGEAAPPPDPRDAYPSFPEMVAYAERMAKELPVLMGRKGFEAGGVTASGPAFPFPHDVFDRLIDFLRACLAASAKAASKSLGEYLASEEVAKPLEAYRGLVEQALHPAGAHDVLRAASAALFEVVSECPAAARPLYGHRLKWVRGFLTVSCADARETMARVLGAVAGSLPDAGAVGEIAADLLKAVAESDPHAAAHAKHGALLGLAHVIACTAGKPSALPEGTVREALALAYRSLDAPVSEVAAAACSALGVVGGRAPLPLPEGSAEEPEARKRRRKEKEEGKKEEGKKEEPEVTRWRVAERLSDLLEAGDVKVVERAAGALGAVLVGEPAAAFAGPAVEALLALAPRKDEQLHFTVGETLAAIGARPSPVPAGEPASAPVDSMEGMLERVLRRNVLEGSPLQRAAGAIWLLAIVKHGGGHGAVQRRLPDVQAAFSRLLSDTNEVTQEIASRGIALVYEAGDEATKQKLVQRLMETMTGSERGRIQTAITPDATLFNEGALGAAPDGGGLSTYRELCAVASDLGKPDLIYKFLDLASHHALWNSRKGMAMGFAHLSEQAREQLAPYVASLVPRLYRYQYDPNPKVQDAMSNIWQTLVPEPKKAVDAHFDAVVAELLRGMGDRIWRIREASCLALADLFPGRSGDQLYGHLGEMWAMIFRALDDIKESVRKAAQVASRNIAGLCTRLCTPEQSSPKDVQRTAEIVLPRYLSSPRLRIKERRPLSALLRQVRKTSLATLLKILGAAGAHVRPFLPETVPVLLESLSQLESQTMNYIQLNAEKYDISQETIEASRLAASASSPVARALDQCVKQCDAGAVEALVPRLAAAIRSGVGLTTRGGTARFITQLAATSAELLRPHSQRLLKSLTAAIVGERSAVLRKAWAGAAAQVVRVASEAQGEALVGTLAKLFLDPGTLEARQTCGAALRELGKQAPDLLKAHQAAVLPVAFLGRNAEEKDMAENYKEVWEEVAGGHSASVRLFLPEIVACAKEALRHEAWPLKQQGAAAIREVAEVLAPPNGAAPTEASAGGEAAAGHMDDCLASLLEMLPGRLWAGKEELLAAFAAVCRASAPRLLGGEDVSRARELARAVLKEAQRPKRDYRAKALEALAAVLDAFHPKVDIFDEVREAVMPLACPAPPAEDPKGKGPEAPAGAPTAGPSGGRRTEEEEAEAREKAKLDDAVRERSVEARRTPGPAPPRPVPPPPLTAVGRAQALGAAFRPSAAGQAPALAAALAASLVGHAFSVRAAALRALAKIAGRAGAPLPPAALAPVAEPLAACAAEVKSLQVRTASLELVQALVAAAGPAGGPAALELAPVLLPAVEALVGDRDTKLSVPGLNLRAALAGAPK